ncbi:5-formyltetrahydrofolate cyclo-ligase [Candidatus Paracaedibacter symbiosus]|uniref:5-formyltetrahydrofolate cyclo-ligase n=1 Tax=Candidatus Paracaedibacter symbiosus TaxID=244582 RepID=UPI0006901C52|nr:5-formyltetrahydrofolate cyclo-ligase [Candidatus Paracaedibacter symbiosus]
MTIFEQKELLRQKMRKLRDQWHQTVNHSVVEQQLVTHFLSLDLLREESVIAGYWAYGSEISVLPLMRELQARGYPVVLPAVAAFQSPLEFRKWDPDLPLKQDLLGIPCPDAGQPILLPTILLVPLLAFDKTGARLGQGGGFYDVTITGLRQKQPIHTVGAGYATQEINLIPTLVTDIHLDYIITEKGSYDI